MNSPMPPADSIDPPFKQDRSVRRRQRLEEAAIEVIARHGIANLTHRLVAATAGVSPGPTTYYFKSRSDIVHAASATALRTYVEAFAAAAARHVGANAYPVAELARRLLRNATGNGHSGALCWAEITLNAARDEQSLALSRDWQQNFLAVWASVARAAGHAQAEAIAVSVVDFLIGAVFMVLALGLGQDQAEAVFRNGACPLEVWKPAAAGPSAPEIKARLTPKAVKTAERMIEAAVTLLVQDGPSAVTFASVARLAAVTPAALSYYFPTIDVLLAVSQQRLFLESKARYRLATRFEETRPLTVESLTDLTATIFLREATEYARRNVAAFALWLEAARKPELRGVIYQAIADQQRAWMRTLSHILPDAEPIDAVIAQSTFIGRLVRTISTGSQLDSLARARREFLHDFEGLAARTFWLRA